MKIKVPIIKIGDYAFFGKRTQGVTIWPFIILKKSYVDNISTEELAVTTNHEKIHIQQQAEMFLLFFYLCYFTEFLVKSLIYSDAYMQISFEREAYANQADPEYLKTRKRWSFIHYL